MSKFVIGVLCVLVLVVNTQAQTNVLTQHNDIGRTGQNLTETVLNPRNVSSGNFGKLYSITLDGQVFAQPLYISSLQIGGVAHSVVFVATEHDSVYAFDANASGTQLWKVSLLDAAHGAASGATTEPESDTGCNDVQGQEYGITGTPVIDTSTGTLYVVSKSVESNYPVQRLHALDITSGAEKFGGPITIQATVSGTGTGASGGTLSFDPKWEDQRPGLLLLGGSVYIAWGSYCDFSPWHGWIMGYSASTGTLQQNAVFVTTPNGSGAGIWTSGGGLSADNISGNQRIFATTGNGTFDTQNDWADTVLNLGLSAGISVVDSFTPYNQDYLSQNDLDLGSGSVLLLPDQAGTYPHLAIVIGKQGVLYLVNRDSLGGKGASTDSVVQEIDASATGGNLASPAYFNGSIYFWPRQGSLMQYGLTNGLLSSTPLSSGAPSQAGNTGTFLGSTPSVSANGTSDAIVWANESSSDVPVQTLFAYDATDVSNLLWSSSQNLARDSAGPTQKFAVPTIADGKVFLAAFDQVIVYGLLTSDYLPSETFGATNATSPVTGALTFTPVIAGATVSAIQVLTDGITGGDFTLAAGGTCSVGSAAPCTVNVTFTPKFPGLRKGAVVITDSTGRQTTTFVSGVGSMTPSYAATPVQSTLVSSLGQPSAVAVDWAGNVYSANSSSGSVTEVSSSGTLVRTIAGLSSPAGLALDGAGNLYVSEAGKGDVVKVLPGATTFAPFAVGFGSANSPQGMTADGAGNIYIADTSNSQIVMVSAYGAESIINTGSLLLALPTGVAVDPAGNLFIADSLNGRIVGVTTKGTASVFANGLNQPSSVAVDAEGNLFVTEANANALDEFVAGSNTPMAIGTGFSGPYGVTVSPLGDVYVADQLNGRIVKLQRWLGTGNPQTITFASIATQMAGTTLALTATASSGLAVTFSSLTMTVCTVSGTTATFLASGTCKIQASQLGNSAYAAAASVSQTFSVIPAQPVITSVLVTSITSTSATITWTTDQATNSLVNYGTTTAYGISSGVQTSLVTGHSVTLTGLTGATTYDFAVVSANSFGTSSTSANAAFTTLSGGTPPYVGYLAFWGINNTGVTISWSTDLLANTQLAYGTTTALGQLSPLQTALTASHGVVLTGLNSGTTYYFVAESTTATGATGYSTTYTFKTTGTAGTPAPVISTVTAANLTSTTATIQWTTDQPSSSQVNYGTTAAYSSSSALDSTLVTSHSVTLTGLTPGTTYNYDVVSANASYTSANSANFTFSTTAAGPPVISGVTATAIGTATATITWTTDQATTSLVNYGTTTTYGSASTLNTTLSTSHSVTLTGLAPATTYEYDVVSANAANAATTSMNFSFVTLVQPGPPVISNVTATNITSTAATINWTTDQATTSLVNFGATTTYGSSSTLNTTLTTSHSVTLTGLTPGTTYNFDVVSANAFNTSSTSSNVSFATIAVTATPPYVGYLAFWGITNSGITISWSTDLLANTELAYGTTPALGQLTPIQTALTASHGVVLTGLNSGTTYYFVAQSTGANGATGYSTTYSFTTTGTAGTPAPVISAVTATSVTTTSATITWTTDEASSSLVNYGASTSYGSSTTLNTALTTSHSVMLTGLTPGVTYDFAVVSANSSGTSSSSANYTFSTTATAPVITNVTATNIGPISATITWTTDQATNSLVNYGTSSNYGSTSTLNTNLVTSHSVTLTGLAAGTPYDFDVVSVNSANLSATSTNATFVTAVQPGPPVISSVTVTNITSTSVTITWTTDQATTSMVNYGASTTYGSSSIPDSTLLTVHSVSLNGLTPGTTYDFDVVSANSANISSASANQTFATISQTATPPVLSYVVDWGINNTGVTVSWSTDVAATSMVAYGTTASLGQLSPVQTALTTSHGVTLTGLTPGTNYYLAAESTGANGATGSSATISFTTTGSVPPVISGITVVPGSNNTATVSWMTSTPSYSYVQFGTTTAYNRYSSQTTLTTNAQPAMGYVPSGVIHYQVVSTDASGNRVMSPDSTFTEP